MPFVEYDRGTGRERPVKSGSVVVSRAVMARHFDALPILIEYVKRQARSSDRATRLEALRCLSEWDAARGG